MKIGIVGESRVILVWGDDFTLVSVERGITLVCGVECGYTWWEKKVHLKA